jgi:hypothetical protein
MRPVRGILRGKIHKTMPVWPAVTQASSPLRMSSAFVMCRRSPVLARRSALVRPDKLHAARSAAAARCRRGSGSGSDNGGPLAPRPGTRVALRLGHAPGSCATPHRLPFPAGARVPTCSLHRGRRLKIVDDGIRDRFICAMRSAIDVAYLCSGGARWECPHLAPFCVKRPSGAGF